MNKGLTPESDQQIEGGYKAELDQSLASPSKPLLAKDLPGGDLAPAVTEAKMVSPETGEELPASKTEEKSELSAEDLLLIERAHSGSVLTTEEQYRLEEISRAGLL